MKYVENENVCIPGSSLLSFTFDAISAAIAETGNFIDIFGLDGGVYLSSSNKVFTLVLDKCNVESNRGTYQ